MLFLSPNLTKAACFIGVLLSVTSNDHLTAAFQNPATGATFISSGSRGNKEATILNAVYDPSQNPGNSGNKTFVLKKKSINDESSGRKTPIPPTAPPAPDATKKISSTSINSFFAKNNSNSKDGAKTGAPAAAKNSDKGASNTVQKKDSVNFFSTFSLPKAGSREASPEPTKSVAVKTPLEKLNTAPSKESVPTSSTTSASDPMENLISKITNSFKKLSVPTPTGAAPSAKTTDLSIAQKQEIKLRPGEEIITNDVTGFTTTIINSAPRPLDPQSRSKFTFEQRIESVKTGVVGLLAGGIALTPFTALHDILFPDESIANGLAQWEFDTDTGSIAAALFAIVYRYCVRDGEQENEMLQMGVVSAFVLVRTFSRIRVPVYCSAAPLDCGEPFGYLDTNMLQQLVGSGLESVVMFGATALAIEYCYEKGYISRFR